MMFDRETAQSKKVIEKINASRGNILDREPISRRAPKGRRSIVSDKSVEYISKDMEKLNSLMSVAMVFLVQRRNMPKTDVRN